MDWQYGWSRSTDRSIVRQFDEAGWMHGMDGWVDARPLGMSKTLMLLICFNCFNENDACLIMFENCRWKTKKINCFAISKGFAFENKQDIQMKHLYFAFRSFKTIETKNKNKKARLPNQAEPSLGSEVEPGRVRSLANFSLLTCSFML